MSQPTHIIIQSPKELNASEADDQAIDKMKETAAAYDPSEHDGQRIRIHLILRNQALADNLKRIPIPDELAEKIELYAYTYEDLWAMNLLGVQPGSTTRLDREAMTVNSNKFVHLVVFGATGQAESLAIHTALTAHYPNYCRNNNFRTRITMVAENRNEFLPFEHRYSHLLSHSYRRYVNITEDNVECSLLEPQYAGIRKDFVDIEWEFVTGRRYNNALLYKLQKWANDEGQQLTLAFCSEDDNVNMNYALSLPTNVLNTTSIWLYCRGGKAMSFLRQSKRFMNIIPFGMGNITQPSLSIFIQLAQCVHFAYNNMRSTPPEEQLLGLSAMQVALDAPSEQQLQNLWNTSRLSTPKIWSNIYNGLCVRSKMHSLGHTTDKWNTLFAISDKEIELLSEVEHNRWCVEELILGYRPTTEKEHTAILKDTSLRSELKGQFIHEDLRHYNELGEDETGQSVVRYDVALTRTLPLMAYTYHLLTLSA